jgi:hypothetical protein
MLPAPDFMIPFKVTDQDEPNGRPVSVKETAKLIGTTGVNVIEVTLDDPLTIRLPEAGVAVNPFSSPTVKAYVPFGSTYAMVVPTELRD